VPILHSKSRSYISRIYKPNRAFVSTSEIPTQTYVTSQRCYKKTIIPMKKKALGLITFSEIRIRDNSLFEVSSIGTTPATLPPGYRFRPTQSLDTRSPPLPSARLPSPSAHTNLRMWRPARLLVRRPRLANLAGKVSKRVQPISHVYLRAVWQEKEGERDRIRGTRQKDDLRRAGSSGRSLKETISEF
jgi:hypothetical protein